MTNETVDFRIETGRTLDFRLLGPDDPADLIVLDSGGVDFRLADDADDVLFDLPAGDKLLDMEIGGEAIISVVYPDYERVYDVIPGPEAQILETANRSVLDDIRIAPIPKNYGLITYNGRTITVS